MLSRADLLDAIQKKNQFAIAKFVNDSCEALDRHLIAAMIANDPENAALACKNGANISILYNTDLGRTLLSVIIEFDYLEIMQWWYRENGMLISDGTSVANDCLFYAASLGRLRMVQWLLKEGGATLIDNLHSDNGNTVFLCAVSEGQLPTARWLLREGGAKITETNKCNEDALSIASERGHLQMLQWLLKKTNIKWNDEVLFKAIVYANSDIAQWLINEEKTLIEAKNCLRRTPLLYAALNFDFEFGMWLLKRGANVFERDIENKTVWSLMAPYWQKLTEENKQEAISFVQALLEQGAGINADLTGIHFELTDKLFFRPDNCVLIGATTHGITNRFEGAINTLEDLRERIGILSIGQIKNLRKAIEHHLAHHPEDEILKEMQSVLKSNLTLNQHCLFAIQKHAHLLPQNYTELVPLEVAERIGNTLQ